MWWTLVFFQFIGDLIFSQLSMNATVTDHCIFTILHNFLSQSFHIHQSVGISQDTTLQHLKIQLKFSLLSHSWILIYCSMSQHFRHVYLCFTNKCDDISVLNQVTDNSGLFSKSSFSSAYISRNVKFALQVVSNTWTKSTV